MTFYNFSVTRIVRIIRAKNYQKFSKFVSYGQNTVGPFLGRGVYRTVGRVQERQAVKWGEWTTEQELTQLC